MAALSQRIDFTDEQAMLLETAVAFCREKSAIRAVRNLLGSETGFDRAVWEEMVALGWSGIAIPEQHGGSGLSLAEVATIAEPMGRHLLATPYVGTQIAVQALLAGPSAGERAAGLHHAGPGRQASPEQVCQRRIVLDAVGQVGHDEMGLAEARQQVAREGADARGARASHHRRLMITTVAFGF